MAGNSEEHSHQIVSYWTSERIQGAQPEPEIDFDASMSAEENALAITSYWTPERIASAQPEEIMDQVHIGTEVEVGIQGGDSIAQQRPGNEVDGAGSQSLKIVPDDSVKMFPYQSVGKLLYTKVSSSGTSRNSYASAWVANLSSTLHVVMTAAHCLTYKGETATKILFIPGFIPPSKELFGKYPQVVGGEGVAWAVDPNWDPNTFQPKYDLGVIKLAQDPNTGKYVDEVVIPIQILSNQQYTQQSEWNTIGYPVSSSQNPDGKMAERSGTYYGMVSGAVNKFGVIPKGISGGPWIYTGSNYSSNGVQSGNSGTFQTAASPYFSSTAQQLVELFPFKS